MRRLQIAISLLALLAAACTSAAGTTSPTTTTTSLVVTPTSITPPETMVLEPERTTDMLEVWAPQSLVGPIGDAATAYEIDTGVDVEVVAVETEGLLETLLADPTAGPDVFIGPHEWLIALTDAGIAEPLAPRSDIVAGAAAAVVLRGVSYASPLALDTIVEFRNPQLLPAAPETMEGLATGCPESGSVGPCVVVDPASADGHYAFVATPGGYVFGPDPFDGWDKDDVGLDTPEALEGGALLESLVAGGAFSDPGEATAEEAFLNGDAPLLWGNAASLSRLQEAGDSFEVEMLASIDGQPARVPVRVTAAWVNAFSADKEAATRLVEGYLAEPVNARTIAEVFGTAPVDVAYDEDPRLIPFVQAARSGDPVPMIAAAALAWGELSNAFADIRGGGAAEDALNAAAADIRAGA